MSASLVGDPAAAGESEQASPLVSVIIPVYNEAEALPGALANTLQQSGNHEIILVDGGSSDRSMEIARGYPGVRVLASSKGRARQMNAGAAVARGEWLLFLHADTLLPEGAIACVARLAADAPHATQLIVDGSEQPGDTIHLVDDHREHFAEFKCRG